ncbi:MAG: DUF2851 family protein [Ignavibacteriales bacterium]|nr:DUF2851 family protein [Ignavibacteriales bacterium]MCF8314919.1 DUF2851 family protein [Ignavibacteriales bacterium]MCF8436132.1 DUF2851 family protein [Ignavibacteriales bacterium]
MELKQEVLEKTLHEIWSKQEFTKPIETLDGLAIEVLDTGVLNTDSAGADFKNARVRIGNLTYVGDIEIDRDYNDWRSHGHNIDNKYNKVILHACLFNSKHHHFVFTKDGRKVPSICLHGLIDENITRDISNYQEKKKQEINFLKCDQTNMQMELELKERFLLNLGFERYDKKCKRIYERLKEITFLNEMKIHEPVVKYELSEQFHKREFSFTDFTNKEIWQQLLYEFIFEALGYTKNKAIMMNLAKASNLKFLKTLGNDNGTIGRIESALFNIAGLVPSDITFPDGPEKIYLDKLRSDWEFIKRIYDGETFEVTKWHFFKLRPQNFPTIRIAGGIHIIYRIMYQNMLETIVKKITEIRNNDALLNNLRSVLIVKGSGFWKNHYVLEHQVNKELKYFIGLSRVDEILINVILPYFSVYFEIFGNQQISKRILGIYRNLKQEPENKLVTDIASGLNMPDHVHRTIFQQGMIELFRTYCSQGKCLECEIGKNSFN